ncbi:MAG: hypothetical protein U9O96_02325 [Candidatus Thermoplasmatota archaeon]|nr:hypothetical protein [Candidatus Thermoplasmatota archaeon]
MGIDFQKYRSWDGMHSNMGQRVLTIVKKGAVLAFKSKWVIALIILTYFFGVVTRLVSIIFMPVKFEPEFFQGFFDESQLWFILMSAVVGSGLIADDLKNNSVVLYFSRVSKAGYITGKFGVLASVLSVVVLLPGILLFFMALLSSSESWSQLFDHLWILGAIMATGLFIIALMGSVSLAISSLTSDKRYAGAGIFIIFLFSGIIAEVLKDILENDRLAMISIWNNVRVVGWHLFNTQNSYNFPWYESLLALAAVIMCSAGIIYWKIFRKEVRV